MLQLDTFLGCLISSFQASNILVQHVSSNKYILESKSNTFLEYHSTDDFLKRHGGNLFNVYRKHFSLTPSTEGSVKSINYLPKF